MTLDPTHCVLIVDDDEDCLTLTRRVLEKVDPSIHAVTAGGGGQAVAYLLRALGSSEGAGQLPSHILLDLHMPGIGGFDVLTWVRCNKALAQVKVVMLTTCDHENDIKRAMELGACGYLVKYPTPEALAEMLRPELSILESNS